MVVPDSERNELIPLQFDGVCVSLCFHQHSINQTLFCLISENGCSIGYRRSCFLILQHLFSSSVREHVVAVEGVQDCSSSVQSGC